MIQFIACVYWLVAYAHGGPHWRCLLYHCLSDRLRPIRSCHFYLSLPGYRSHCDFSYWHLLPLFLCNPVILLNYGRILTFVWCFSYAIGLLFYLFVCYCIGLYLLLHFPIVAGTLQSFTIVALFFATAISLLDAIAAIYGKGTALCRILLHIRDI